jgi:hypothetical protein
MTKQEKQKQDASQALIMAAILLLQSGIEVLQGEFKFNGRPYEIIIKPAFDPGPIKNPIN